MSLIISSPIETENGIALNGAYARLSVTDPMEGTQLYINMDYYPTQLQFTEGKMPLRMDPSIMGFTMPYDRQTEGADTLMLAHEYAQFQLDSKGIASTIAELN